MSLGQRASLRTSLAELAATELHHGDCVGADAEAAEIARELGVAIVVHPPDDPKLRAFSGRFGDTVHDPRPYLERNRAIVDATEVLIAAPAKRAGARSGTWATIRYARARSRTTRILEP